jgi:hypothetical protein
MGNHVDHHATSVRRFSLISTNACENALHCAIHHICPTAKFSVGKRVLFIEQTQQFTPMRKHADNKQRIVVLLVSRRRQAAPPGDGRFQQFIYWL